MKLKVNVDELMSWARTADEVATKTPEAIARAINAYGEGVVRGAAQTISDKTGIPVNLVAESIIVKPASPGDLTWVMDASVVDPPDGKWQRPWAGRDAKTFQQSMLVKIITVEDECVCEVCQEAALGGPYTMDEITQMQAKWANFVPSLKAPGTATNLVHPNCRCVIQSFKSMRKLAVAQSGRGTTANKFTVKQLGSMIAGEIRTQIRVVKGKV